MRMYQLFARIKEATPETKGVDGYKPRFRQECYDLLRFIIQNRHKIGLENDKLETMCEKSYDITKYILKTKKSKDEQVNTIMFLLKLAREALGEDDDDGYCSSAEDFEGDDEDKVPAPQPMMKRSLYGCEWLKKMTLWGLQTTVYVTLNAIVLKQMMHHVLRDANIVLTEI